MCAKDMAGVSLVVSQPHSGTGLLNKALANATYGTIRRDQGHVTNVRGCASFVERSRVTPAVR